MKRFPRRAALAPLLLVGWLGAASPVAALSFTLTLVPADSTLVPAVGASQTLSGTLSLEVELPLLAPTLIELTDVSVTSSGGASFALDPDIASAGLGVLQTDGSFLIPTLFLVFDGGFGPQDLAVLNVTGQLDVSELAVTALSSTFAVDSLGPAGVVTVTLYAVPESGSLGLVATGLLAIALRRRSKEIAR